MDTALEVTTLVAGALNLAVGALLFFDCRGDDRCRTLLPEHVNQESPKQC